MAPRVIDSQEGFSGGLNKSGEEATLAQNEMREATNYRLAQEGGSALRRYGTQRTTAARPDAVEVPFRGYAWRVGGATTDLLAVGGNTTGKLYTGSLATTGVPMTWTFVGNLNNSSVFPSFAAFRDSAAEACYIAQSGLKKFKAGVLSTPAGTPASISVIAVQNQRLFGVTGADNTLWYSGLNDGDTLGIEASGGGSQVIRTFGNQSIIVGLAAVGASLLIFHQNGISKFTGYGQGDITIASGTRGVSADVGTIAPQSIVVVENVCYFLTERGFFAATEEGVFPISQKIERIFEDGLNTTVSAFFQVQGAHYRAKREVWWSFPGDGCYVYNYRLKAWTGPMNGALASIYALWETFDSNGKSRLLAGSQSDGFVKLVDYGTGSNVKDNVLSDGTGGSAFTSTIKCHRMHLGSQSEKAFRFIEIRGDDGGSANCYLQYDTNYASAAVTDIFALTAGTKYARKHIGGRGYYIDLYIINAGVTYDSWERLEVQGFDYGHRY
jgi:hypothetical protein